MPNMRARAAVFSVLILALAACGPAERPSFSAWTPDWETTAGLVPASSSLEGEPERVESICNDTVADLRVAQENILPTPDRALDGLVREWFELAEQTFFECPPNEGETIGFPAAYAELERIEADIAAAIEGGD